MRTTPSRQAAAVASAPWTFPGSWPTDIGRKLAQPGFGKGAGT